MHETERKKNVEKASGQPKSWKIKWEGICRYSGRKLDVGEVQDGTGCGNMSHVIRAIASICQVIGLGDAARVLMDTKTFSSFLCRMSN